MRKKKITMDTSQTMKVITINLIDAVKQNKLYNVGEIQTMEGITYRLISVDQQYHSALMVQTWERVN